MISSQFTVHSISQTLFFFTTLFKYFIYFLFILFLPPTSSHHLYNQNPIPATIATTPALLHHHHQPTITETYTQPQIQLDQKYPPLKHPPPTHNHRNLYSATDPTQLEIPTTGNPKPLR